MVPGRADTLRINGRARLVRDGPFFDDMVVRGHRPLLALVVEVEQVFHHCGEGVPALPAVGAGQLAPRRAAAPVASSHGSWSGRVPTWPSWTPYYGPSYAERLYHQT